MPPLVATTAGEGTIAGSEQSQTQVKVGVMAVYSAGVV
jgi:hypothetical protein